MILKTIRREIEEFTNESIQIVDGLNFNQKETIDKIYYYYLSKYESGEIDSQGDKKYFYNINRNPCNVGTKAIDFDTKNINIQTAGGGTPLKTWFFERDLKFWMKIQKFGKVLNRIFHELPIFGSVVLKIVDGKPYFVDLRNFVVEQSADTLDKANYKIEKHNYTPIDFKKIAEKKNWDNVEEVLEQFREGKDLYIKVYERYGEVEEDGKYIYKRVIMADVGQDFKDDETGIITPKTGIILNEEEVDKHPYWEFHWEKIPGRWLGIGRVEILFDPQIRTNEITNQQVKSSYWSTLRIWQTRDEGVKRNLLTDVANGEVLNVESEITQVDMADRNLAYYSQEIGRWMGNRDELTFSYDVVRGERLPSGTPLGSARIAAGMVSSYFEQIRENVAMNVKDLLYEVIIPQFKKENSTEHILRIAGEDLDKVNNLIIQNKTRNKTFEFIKREKKFPNRLQIDLIKSTIVEAVKKNKEQLIKIGAGFYKDIKYIIEIVITGESLDTSIRAATLFAALQAITADPTLLTDPVKKKFFYRYLEQGGISPIDLEISEEPKGLEEITRKAVGGGISRPVMAPAMAGTRETTL